MALAGRALVSIQDIADDELEAIMATAEGFAADLRAHGDLLAGHVVGAAFFEPSTRTRLSFEAAAARLGASVIGFAEPGSTSSAKGESLEDTARVLGGYCDLLVLRHPEVGAAARAAAVAGVPVINAGDGAGEHPTQTLLDLFTMRKQFGSLQGRRVAVVGDLRHGRTVHSLVPALHRAGAEVVQVPAADLRLDDTAVPSVDLHEAAASSDVLYVTRIQRERFADVAAYDQARAALRVDRKVLEAADSKAIIMHPLPRVDELAVDVDGLAAAKFFDQARNGVPVRMAVLAHLAGVS